MTTVSYTYKLEQENKQLKEEYEILLGRPFRNDKDIGKLKQNIINDKVELNKLKQVVDKIEKVIEHGIAEDGFDDQPEIMCFDIEKILKEKT